MNSQDSSCEWRKKIVKPNSPCVLSLEDKTNAAEHKVLRPNPKKDSAVRQTSVPKSKTARPKYHQLRCGSNETVLAVPLHSEISVVFSFPVCPAASACWGGMSGSLWKPARRGMAGGSSEHILPHAGRLRLEGLTGHNSLFPNVPDGTGCVPLFSTPYSWVFGEVWSGAACCQHKPCEGPLRELGVLSLEKRRLTGTLLISTTPWQDMQGVGQFPR